MSTTQIIQAVKINENSFFIDVLYYSSTSYSKSLYPTTNRAFKKWANSFTGGGTFSSVEEDIEIKNQHEVYSIQPYNIKRITFTRK